jgi:hypothetical protein
MVVLPLRCDTTTHVSDGGQPSVPSSRPGYRYMRPGNRQGLDRLATSQGCCHRRRSERDWFAQNGPSHLQKLLSTVLHLRLHGVMVDLSIEQLLVEVVECLYVPEMVMVHRSIFVRKWNDAELASLQSSCRIRIRIKICQHACHGTGKREW